MEIPFDHIVDTEFTNAAPGYGLASFMLSQPPIFYLENVSSPRADGTLVREWKLCADWTENQQASTVLRHDLIGSAVQLAHVLRNLHPTTPDPDVRLDSPAYDSPAESPPAPMQLPQPPLAGLTGPGFQFRDESEPQEHLAHSRKRSYSGPPIISHHSSHDESGFPSIDERPRDNLVPTSATFAHSPFSHVSDHIQTSSNYASLMFSDFSDTDSPPNIVRQPLSDYGPVTDSSPRPYTAQPVPRSFYNGTSRLLSMTSPYHMEGFRRHSSASTSLPQALFNSTPSPPLLTTPYYPRSHITANIAGSHSPDELNASPPLISGMPGIQFESDNDLHLHEELS
jgi:regulatory protein PHO2